MQREIVLGIAIATAYGLACFWSVRRLKAEAKGVLSAFVDITAARMTRSSPFLFRFEAWGHHAGRVVVCKIGLAWWNEDTVGEIKIRLKPAGIKAERIPFLSLRSGIKRLADNVYLDERTGWLYSTDRIHAPYPEHTLRVLDALAKASDELERSSAASPR